MLPNVLSCAESRAPQAERSPAAQRRKSKATSGREGHTLESKSWTLLQNPQSLPANSSNLLERRPGFFRQIALPEPSCTASNTFLCADCQEMSLRGQGFRFSQYRVSRRPRAIRAELRGACEAVGQL